MKASGIYAIRNLVNGKRYVGSAVYLTGRFCDHKKRLRLGKHHSVKMQRAWNKYGEQNFAFEILEVVPDLEKLIATEQKWLEHFNAACPRRGYNVSPTAGSCRGVRHGEETRAKISAVQRGRKQSPETRAKRAQAMMGHAPWSRGRVCTPEQIARMSVAQKGKVFSQEHRANLSAARMGIKYSAETLARMSASHMGHQQSNETRAKRAESMRAAWARRKSESKSGPASASP